jgi:hypothetical protein
MTNKEILDLSEEAFSKVDIIYNRRRLIMNDYRIDYQELKKAREHLIAFKRYIKEHVCPHCGGDV